MMDHLGANILEIIECSKQPLSLDQIVNKCHQEKNKVEESLNNLLSIGIITVNLQGQWSLSTGDKDDLCQDAECYSGSLSNTYSYPQQETSQTEPTNAQTDPKVPLESMSSNDTAPKESSYSASNVQNWSSPAYHEPKADRSHTKNPRVPHRKVSDTNIISSTPIIQEVTLSGEDGDMCTVLEATTLKEPVQSFSDNAVVPRNVSHSVVPRQNSNQTTIAVGGASIETSGQVKIMQLSTVDPHKNVLEKVFQLLRGSSAMKPLDIAKVCIGKSASKRDINRYLHYLEKAGFVSVDYLNKANKSNPVWSALPKARDITEEKIIELASELSKSPSKSRSQLELVPSSPASSHQYPSSGNSTPHITEHHHHYHKHEHHTLVQVGEKNSMHVNVPDIECDRERITEQEVEKES